MRARGPGGPQTRVRLPWPLGLRRRGRRFPRRMGRGDPWGPGHAPWLGALVSPARDKRGVRRRRRSLRRRRHTAWGLARSRPLRSPGAGKRPPIGAPAPASLCAGISPSAETRERSGDKEGQRTGSRAGQLAWCLARAGAGGGDGDGDGDREGALPPLPGLGHLFGVWVCSPRAGRVGRAAGPWGLVSTHRSAWTGWGHLSAPEPHGDAARPAPACLGPSLLLATGARAEVATRPRRSQPRAHSGLRAPPGMFSSFHPRKLGTEIT